MRYIPDFITEFYNRSPYFVKNTASTLYGVLKTIKERNSLYKNCLKELDITLNIGKTELQEIQFKRLQEIYRHSINTVPFYKDLYGKYGLSVDSIKQLSDLEKLPVISKEELRSNYKNRLSDDPTPLQMVAETSGTTGKPLITDIDHLTEAYHNAVVKYQEKIAGVRKGWFGVMAGIQILPITKNKPPYWIINYFNKQVHYSSFHLNKDTLRFYENHMRKKNIRFLKGYPTVIGSLAKLMLDSGKRYKLDGVFTSSQPLQDWTRKAIKEAFQCEIYDFYGLAERSVWAISMGRTNNLFVVSPICIVEFKKNDHSDEFSMIVTNLINRRMPVIRYELDDLSFPIKDNSHGFKTNWFQIAPIKSRRGDYIKAPDGRILPAPSFTIAFWGVNGIIESQVHQTSKNILIIRIIPSKDFNDTALDIIMKKIKNIVGDDMQVTIVLTDQFVVGKTGKRQFILRDKNI